MAKRVRLYTPPYGKACEGCPLYDKKQFVLFESPETAKYAVIGESPGRTEILDRRPFIGESGQLLNQVLRIVGAKREDLFVGNVVQCRAVGLPDTKPTYSVTEQCGRITAELMHRRGVTDVLALGGFALSYFMGSTGRMSIMRMHGNPFTSRRFGKEGYVFRVMPTFHPAALLRRPEGFEEFLHDFEIFFHPEKHVEYVPGSYHTVTDLVQALAILDSWKDKDRIVIDLETSGYSPHSDAMICVAMSAEPQSAFVFAHEVISQRAFWRKIKELNDRKRWVMHGAFFDHRWVYWKTGIDLKVANDTMLSNYALDERGGVHDLKQIAANRFDFPDWEANIKKYLKRTELDSYAKIPRDVLYKYAAFDADAEIRLDEAHRQELTPTLQKLLDDILIPGTVALGKISLTGIEIDTDHWQRLHEKYGEVVEHARLYMQRYVGDANFNPNSFKQVQRYMYDVFHLPTHDQSAKLGHHPKLSSGRTSDLPPRTTAMDQLERLSDGYEQSSWIRALIAFRTKRKAITVYLKGYKPNPRTGRIHPRYLVHGTRTGRLSSRDPNIMNAPHYGYIRELVIPREGCVLVSVDYSQAELRVLAALSHSQKMAEVYRQGGDLHNIVSTEIFGSNYSKRERMIAKAIVFGLVYGRSISNIAETFGLSMSKAQEYYYTFLGRFDGVEEWMDAQKRFALENGYVELPTGNRRRFPLITRSNVAEVQRQAVNSPVQGTTSHFMFISLTELLDYTQSIDGNILFPLHDSIMFELPIGIWKEAVIHIVNVMEEVPTRYFGDFLPFVADCDVGWRWGQLVGLKRPVTDGVIQSIEDTLMTYDPEPEPEDWWEGLDWNLEDWEDDSVATPELVAAS